MQIENRKREKKKSSLRLGKRELYYYFFLALGMLEKKYKGS